MPKTTSTPTSSSERTIASAPVIRSVTVVAGSVSPICWRGGVGRGSALERDARGGAGTVPLAMVPSCHWCRLAIKNPSPQEGCEGRRATGLHLAVGCAPKNYKAGSHGSRIPPSTHLGLDVSVYGFSYRLADAVRLSAVSHCSHSGVPAIQRSLRVIEANQAGEPGVLTMVDRPSPSPGPGEVLVEVAAAGVNFIDTYRRSGVYPASYPHVPGSEGAGTVTALGPDVSDLAIGDRIAWSEAQGSYAERVVVPARAALRVPAGLDLHTAAALPLQGLTAHYLCASTYPVTQGDVALVHAGAGGVGLLLTQLIVSRGARVITTVSTAAKEQMSRRAGASDVIRYTELTDLPTQLPERVRELTDGRGVDVVYDGVGRDTFDASLGSLRPRGMLVLFGGSSGQVPPFDLQIGRASC